MAIRTLPRLAVVVVAVLVVVVGAVLVTRLLAESDETGWSSNGITLNTSSWEPGDDANDALIVSVVRIDSNGCVYARPKGVEAGGGNILWPAGYTASREPDGTVTILNPDGVVVAAVGHPLRAGGGSSSSYELACRAQDSTGAPFMINEDLPPLSE